MKKNKILAIEGHFARQKEVIEILEMLGGKMKGEIIRNSTFNVYYINLDGNIDYKHFSQINDAMIFTLEEFLAKYPYKVGDMVQHKGSTSCRSIYKITKMIWKDNQIHYLVYNPWQEYDKCTITAEYLQPYKEEIYTDYSIDEDSKTDITIDGEKLIVPKGYTVKNATTNGNSLIVEYVKNKPQYPNNYAECYEIMNIPKNQLIECCIFGYKAELLSKFQQLLICRDAYWKIAGEEMGLSESWKPNFGENFIYAIGASYGTIQKIMVSGGRGILLFPTEEMNDAFYENFKDLIEACKDYL